MRPNLLRKLVAASAFLALSASATIAHAAPIEILTNPGFETGALAPWFQDRDFGGSQNWTTTSLVTHSGTFSATDNGNKEIRQDFAAVATNSISSVSFWAEHPDAAITALFVDLFYSDLTDTGFVVSTSGTGWNFFDVTGNLAGGKDLIGFSIFGNSGGITYFDDASIIADVANPVPEPASMLLIGTGLVGMSARRWRTRRQGV